MSKITTKNLKTFEFKMVTNAYDFLVTICIKKGKSHNSKWRDTFVKYFECSGEVFEDHDDCFHLAYLIDDMLSNEENDLTLKMSQDKFYSGTTLHYPEGISD
ncbi:MAG: hypothetical protein Q8O23_01840 [Gallionella sp.]|nr:hypothetical protein [Gallionella sp.]